MKSINRRQFLVQTGGKATTCLIGGLLARNAVRAQDPSGPLSSAATPTRLAIIGFQHPHIWGLVAAARARPDVEIVAACEEDPVMREILAKSGRIKITHSDYHQLLAEPGIDAIAVGEWYGKRGRVVADSLRSGHPVISDKPLCTTLEDYEEISHLAHASKLTVSMLLDQRDLGAFITMRELVHTGVIGDVREIAVGAEHPLLLKTRPHWYNEAGKHGGTINDIGVHGFDSIPWITGLSFRRVVAARVWKTKGVPENSHFLNAGQAMMEMENGAGLGGSFSYVSPSSMGYTLPLYWRLTIWGGEGVIEAGHNSPAVTLYKEGEKAGRAVPAAPNRPGGPLETFLRQIRGQTGGAFTTDDVLRATRVALKTQAAADKDLRNVML